MYFTKSRKFSSPIPSDKPKNQALRKVLNENYSLEISIVNILSKKSKNAKAKRKLFFKFVLPTYGKLVSKGCNSVKTYECKSGGDGCHDILKNEMSNTPLTIQFRQDTGDQVIANVESEENRVVNFSKNELEKGIYIVIGSEGLPENAKPLVKFLVEREEILTNNKDTSKTEICEECSEKVSIASTSYYSDLCIENELKEQSDDDYFSALSHQSSLTQLFVRKTGKKNRKDKRYKSINTIHTKNFNAEPSCNYLLKLKNYKNKKITDNKYNCSISNECSCANLVGQKANLEVLIEDKKRLRKERHLTSVSQVLKGVAIALKPLQEQLVDLKTKMANFKEYEPKKASVKESTTNREIQQIVSAIMSADGTNDKLPKYFIGNPCYSEPKRKINLSPQSTLKKFPYWDEPEICTTCTCHMKNHDIDANYYETNFKPMDIEHSETLFNFTPEYDPSITRRKRI